MLYITYENSLIQNIGFWKKVQAQYRVFKKAFGKAYYTVFRGQMIYLYADDELLEKRLAFTKKECYEAVFDWIEKYGITKTYTRHCFADRHDLVFYQRMMETGVNSVVEFPTILSNWETVNSQTVALEDKYYRNQLHKYVKCCTTFHDVDEVYGIPSILLLNGVDMDEQPPKKYRKKDGKIVLLSVAIYGKWNGYERLLEGMYQYYNNGGERNIIYNVVGAGDQLNYYNNLVKKYNLQDHVNFCGLLAGKELDEMYDSSDIAIGDLGIYKLYTLSAAPIKEREYCARGIPFIYGYDDISFDKDNYFTYKVCNNESPIDVHEIIHFYDTMYDGRDFITDMRQYALSTQTWEKILQPVIDYYMH